jgi:hypothetical protein
MNEPFFVSNDGFHAEPFEPKRLDEDHSKAETREGGCLENSHLAKRGFRSAPSGTVESGAYRGI